MGNDEGWKDFDQVTPEVGAATHAFAAFEPSIESTFTMRSIHTSTLLTIHQFQTALIC